MMDSRIKIYLSLYKIQNNAFLFDPYTGECVLGGENRVNLPSGNRKSKFDSLPVKEKEGKYYMQKGILEMVNGLNNIGIKTIFCLPCKITDTGDIYKISPFLLGHFKGQYFCHMPWLSDWSELVRTCGEKNKTKIVGITKNKRSEIMLEDMMSKYPWMWEKRLDFKIKPIERQQFSFPSSSISSTESRPQKSETPETATKKESFQDILEEMGINL